MTDALVLPFDDTAVIDVRVETVRVGPALARVTDPATSHAAARRQRGGAERAILDLMASMPERDFTADELHVYLRAIHPPTLVSALSRMKKAGRIEATGWTRPSVRGSEMTCWRLA